MTCARCMALAITKKLTARNESLMAVRNGHVGHEESIKKATADREAKGEKFENATSLAKKPDCCSQGRLSTRGASWSIGATGLSWSMTGLWDASRSNTASASTRRMENTLLASALTQRRTHTPQHAHGSMNGK